VRQEKIKNRLTESRNVDRRRSINGNNQSKQPQIVTTMTKRDCKWMDTNWEEGDSFGDGDSVECFSHAGQETTLCFLRLLELTFLGHDTDLFVRGVVEQVSERPVSKSERRGNKIASRDKQSD